jgi:hypothetical protein
MRKLILAAALVLVFAGPSYAQLSCGSSSTGNWMWQVSGGLQAVEHQVLTSRTWSICPIYIRTESWVDGIANTATSTDNAYTATTHQWVPVPSPGTWYGPGKHFAIWTGVWYNLGGTRSSAEVKIEVPDPAPNCNPPIPDYYCTDGGGRVDGTGCFCEYPTPIIASLTGQKVRLSGPDECVMFDIDADDQKECVSWPKHGSWLALDRNGNGTIDSAAELFGDSTPVRQEQDAKETAENGFEALQFMQGADYAGKPDTVIDANDGIFGKLLWWTDDNPRDGLATPDELLPVSQSGLKQISLNYRTTKRVDRWGNHFGWEAQSVWVVDENGGTRIEHRPVWDVSVMIQSTTQ